MGMLKNVLGILLASSILFACKKGQADFVIKGEVTNNSLHEPLDNATITLTKTSVENGSEQVIATLTTDAQGKYSYTLPRDRFQSLTLKVEKNNFFTAEKTIGFSALTTKEDNVLNLATTGKSWVRIHLKHTESAATKFNIVRTEGKSDCEECCPSSYQLFQGIIDTTYYCINDANTLYKVTYFKTGTSFSGDKSVTTIFNDTVDISVEY